MANYRFYKSADIQQDKIWRYTEEEWGKRQADKYIIGLHKHLQKLAERKVFWHVLPERLAVPVGVKLQAYFSHYEKHIIFFRELDASTIGIISILHEAMDIPLNLKQDLQKALTLNPSP